MFAPRTEVKCQCWKALCRLVVARDPRGELRATTRLDVHSAAFHG